MTETQVGLLFAQLSRMEVALVSLEAEVQQLRGRLEVAPSQAVLLLSFCPVSDCADE